MSSVKAVPDIFNQGRIYYDFWHTQKKKNQKRCLPLVGAWCDDVDDDAGVRGVSLRGVSAGGGGVVIFLSVCEQRSAESRDTEHRTHGNDHGR